MCPGPRRQRRSNQLRAITMRVKFLLFVALGVASTMASLSFANTSASASESRGINTADRSEVARTYLSQVDAAFGIAPQWSGSTHGCRAGDTSAAFRNATLDSINWFRQMSGLTSVTEDTAVRESAQAAALIMDAHNNLSHYPASSWRCHSESGAASAGRANLSLGAIGADAVAGQIEDDGVHNTALGHRRWLLYPRLSEVGLGSTSRAAVVEVIGDFGPRQSSSPWVSWPPPGFVPHEVIFERWSLSHSSADFSEANVSVTIDGQPVSTTILPLADGFGDPTLAWELAGGASVGRGDVTYRVEVTNIIVSGNRQSTSYIVTGFDPRTAPLTTYTCVGQPATIVGTMSDDVIVGTSTRDVIVALGGNDRIEAKGGNDLICAGGGNDIVLAGFGNDRVVGGNGRDTIFGNQGADVLRGNDGRDTIDGGLGNDLIVGGAHIDHITGGAAGSDVCWGLRIGQVYQHEAIVGCESGR